MSRDEFNKALYQISFYVATNQSYNQFMKFAFAVGDRLLKIVLGLVAVGDVVASEGSARHWAIAALALAIIVNISPLDAWERAHHELYRQWTELARAVDALVLSFRDSPNSEAVPGDMTQELSRLTAQRSEIEIGEMRPFRFVMGFCQKQENQRRWGVRKNAAIEKKKATGATPVW